MVMTKGQILKRKFIRFLEDNFFDNASIDEIWEAFIKSQSIGLDTEENFVFLKKFFEDTLVKHFEMNSSCIPPQYTSVYHQYQLKKYLLPEKYKSSYEFLFQKIQDLKQEYTLNEIEANCLKECMKEIPEIGCQIQWSLYQRKQISCEIKSKLNVYEELIKSFEGL